MKKIFTLAAAVLASFSLWAADEKIYTFDDNVDLSTDWVVETDVPSGGTATCEISQSIGGSFAPKDNNYLGLAYLNKSGIGITLTTTEEYTDIEAVSIDAVAGDNGKPTIAAYIVTETGDVEVFAAVGTKDGFATGGSNKWGNKTVTLATPVTGKLKIVTVASSSGKYAALDNIKITYTAGASSTDPVTEVSITGDANTYVGGSATLKASAKGATEFWWTLKGDANKLSETNTFEFSPTVAGEFTFVAYAQNEYNTTPASAEFTVTVAGKLCGELIKAVHVNKNTATVTGVVGGTADKNTQDNGKLGSNGHYFGVKPASGSFMAGDVVTIVASALNGGNTATLYSDKGENELGSADFDAETLTATYTLTASANAIYVYRASSACNPAIESITVTRACEASNNAGIGKLTINGVEVEAVENVYSYEVSASENLAQVEVVYSLAHPLANATPASGFKVDVPAAGATANTQVISVTAEDGETKATYTVSVTKSAAMSTDATLSALAVEGYTLTPAFDPEVTAYTITKAYTAEDPAVTAVTATPADAQAKAVVAAEGNVLKVTVTAEDGETKKEYTITVERAAANKDLLEVTFSNGVHGFIANGEIKVPYLAGEAQPTFVSARFWNADGEPIAKMADGKLVVTGIDEESAEYTIVYEELTPMVMTTDTITFDAVPSYIYSVYGWDADKGVKFSKDVEEAANKRISEGKDRIYIALPAAQNVSFVSGSGNKRPVRITLNGAHYEDVTTPAKDGVMTINLDPTTPNLVGIESNGNNGDCGFVKMWVTEAWATGFENTEMSEKAVKMIENGQMFILKNGVKYNAQGAVVK
ncbi:MAG: cadherin-like beta sandwich domain-containing protein [Paludibacteraceae bacterium]|nr:cadherin-like beta sandwich domain-containing protein [Paludibacteraceae bacterium]